MIDGDSLPSDWGLRRLKTVADIRTSNVDKKTDDGEATVRLCNYTDVYYSDMISDPSEFMVASAAPKEISRFHLRRDDVLITKDSESRHDIAVPAYVATDFEDVLCGYHLALARPDSRSLDGRFLHYCFLTAAVADQFAVGANGITRFGLSQDVLGGARLPLPPLPTQRAIASFLDREIEKIDTLINKKRRLLDLLEEKRAVLITRAVTRGVDPDVPMKDSGVKWLGEIPEHWEVIPVGLLCERITYGFTNPMPTSEDHGHPPMLTANDIGWGDVLYESARRTTPEALESELTAKSLPARHDVLLTKDGTLGRVGLHDGRRACINQSVALLRTRWSRLTPEFLLAALRGQPYQDRMRFEAGGTTIKHIYVSRLAKMPLAVPPLPEQRSIAKSVPRGEERVSQLVSRVAAAISLLQEYRTSLISHAVTGKIDVHDKVPDMTHHPPPPARRSPP